MYEWVDHTAELELRLEGESEREIFVSAMEALAELLDGETAGEQAREGVATSAPDRATLLAEWLNELVYLAEARGFIPGRTERLELSGQELEATVAGRLGSPRPLVKAVTYHGLSLREDRGVWRATVVLDV